MTHVQVPVSQAMILCDGVHMDPSTGKFFLMGTVDAVRAKEFPATVGLLCVYVCLTDGMGLVDLRFQVVDAAEEREPIHCEDSKVPWASPLQVIQQVFILPGLTFPEAGAYNFQVKSGDSLIIERRLVVQGLEKPT